MMSLIVNEKLREKYVAVFDIFDGDANINTVESEWYDTFEEAMYAGHVLAHQLGDGFQVVKGVQPHKSKMEIP